MVSKFGFVFQWPDLLFFWKNNWSNFAVADVSFEYGTYRGTYLEFRVVLLGLGFAGEIAARQEREAWDDEMDERVSEAKAALVARRGAETQREQYLHELRASGGTREDVPKLLGIIETMRRGGKEYGIYTMPEVMEELG